MTAQEWWLGQWVRDSDGNYYEVVAADREGVRLGPPASTLPEGVWHAHDLVRAARA